MRRRPFVWKSGWMLVSERFGHASVSLTLDTYGHVMLGQQVQAVAAAASLLRA